MLDMGTAKGTVNKKIFKEKKEEQRKLDIFVLTVINVITLILLYFVITSY